MADEGGEKTEPATPKRRRDARKKGDVPQSREIVGVLTLLAVLLAGLSALGSGLAAALLSQARSAWSGSEITPGSLADFHALLLQHGISTGAVLLPFLVVLLLAGVAGSFVQIGPLFTTSALAFRPDRINPLQGLKRLVNLEKLFELLKAFVKIGVAVGALWIALGSSMGQVMSLSGAELISGLALAGKLIIRVTILFLIGLALFAVLDVSWVRYRFEKKLRMTKQEVRDELKQREGDPKVKARMRARQRDLSRLRMIAEVAEADVVVTNPVHYAVALRYVRESMGAPKVIAKGRNKLALRIRQVARKHGVPIVENPPLAQLLYRIAPLGREIPDSLYKAVAEVLAHVSRLDPRRARAWQAAS